MPDDVKQAVIDHTSFLNYNAPIVTRVSYILNSRTTQISCNTCGTLLNTETSIERAPRYCSLRCSARNAETKKLRETTSLDRYGVNNPAKLTATKEKIAETNLKKYGVDNPAKSANVRAVISEKNSKNSESRMLKSRITTRDRYGVDHISQVDAIKQQKQKTSIKNHGAVHYWASDAYKQHYKESMLQNYGVENPSKLPQTIDKIKQTKLQRYNNSQYNNSEKTKQTMQQRYGGHFSNAHWSTYTRHTISSRSRLSKQVSNKTVYAAAADLEVAPTTVYRYLHHHQITHYIHRTNQYEDLIEQLLIEYNLRYQKNVRTLIPPYEIDFYLPDHALGIEVNGMYWHSELMGKTAEYHLSKTLQAADAGIQLLHIWDHQMDKKMDVVNSMILHIVGKYKNKVGARACTIQELDSLTYREFLNRNHLQGSVNSKIKLGLWKNNVLVAVMGFGNSRFEPDVTELHRFSVKTYYHVPGAASKLFNYFLTNYAFGSKIISYASRDYSLGNLYNRLGFEAVSITPPGFTYFKSREIYSRLKFQKHKLKLLLPNFNPLLTEWENMKNHGYNRFWNTGNIKYEYYR